MTMHQYKKKNYLKLQRLNCKIMFQFKRIQTPELCKKINNSSLLLISSWGSESIKLEHTAIFKKKKMGEAETRSPTRGESVLTCQKTFTSWRGVKIPAESRVDSPASFNNFTLEILCSLWHFHSTTHISQGQSFCLFTTVASDTAVMPHNARQRRLPSPVVASGDTSHILHGWPLCPTVFN